MSCGLPAPGTSKDFTVRALAADAPPFWYHVYCDAVHPATATAFSKGWGDTRLALIPQADNSTPVHTYCVANTREAAYLKSVVHNVALSAPGVLNAAARLAARWPALR